MLIFMDDLTFYVIKAYHILNDRAHIIMHVNNTCYWMKHMENIVTEMLIITNEYVRYISWRIENSLKGPFATHRTLSYMHPLSRAKSQSRLKPKTE